MLPAKESMKAYDISIQRPSGKIVNPDSVLACECDDGSTPATAQEATVSRAESRAASKHAPSKGSGRWYPLLLRVCRPYDHPGKVP